MDIFSISSLDVVSAVSVHLVGDGSISFLVVDHHDALVGTVVSARDSGGVHFSVDWAALELWDNDRFLDWRSSDSWGSGSSVGLSSGHSWGGNNLWSGDNWLSDWLWSSVNDWLSSDNRSWASGDNWSWASGDNWSWASVDNSWDASGLNSVGGGHSSAGRRLVVSSGSGSGISRNSSWLGDSSSKSAAGNSAA